MTTGKTVDEVHPSEFLKKEDLGNTAHVLTIADSDIVTLEDKQRIQLSFQETEKKLTLNVTAARTIEKMHGPQIDSWTGKKIEVYVDPSVTFKGQMVGGIKVRPAGGWGSESEPQPADDLPF